MRVDDFDFVLPEELIALRPIVPRDHARLLYVDEQFACHDYHIYDLPNILRAGDVIVSNNTRVLAVRLRARRVWSGVSSLSGGAEIDVTLTSALGGGYWQCFLRPARRVDIGDALIFANGTRAMIIARDGGCVDLDFGDDPDIVPSLLAACGEMPLPPYIANRRAGDARDMQDYQTLFARRDGAIAAPTAGLHFTDSVMAGLKARGVLWHEITLHVGIGTFLPVKVARVSEHVMHPEWGELSPGIADSLNTARGRGGRLIAIGTTSARLLESAARSDGQLMPFAGETDIFIMPGYRFRVCDMLLTNFHLPRSTLLMLIAGFVGLPCVRDSYAHAISRGYRFYSYGDACLFTRAAL